MIHLNKIIYQDNEIIKFLIESPKYGNKEVIIDKEDYNKIKNYRWGLAFDKHINGFYVKTDVFDDNKKHYTLLLHRVILNLTNSKMQGDHKDCNTLDNRKQNLRECTTIQNSINKRVRKDNTSGYKGVSWDKQHKLWKAYIYFNKKQIYFGLFKDKIEAALAYNKAASKYFGEFARLNTI
jgi:hypothetical protein